MIYVCSLQRNDQSLKKAFEFFIDLLNCGFEPTSYTYCNLIQLCTKLREFAIGKLLWQAINININYNNDKNSNHKKNNSTFMTVKHIERILKRLNTKHQPFSQIPASLISEILNTITICQKNNFIFEKVSTMRELIYI